MTGIAATWEIEGLVDVGRALGRLSRLDLVELADAAGELLVSSTQRRIAEEKEGPEGENWPVWSPAYAATRIAGTHSLLVGENHLLTSLQNYTEGEVVRIGSPLPYAGVHQGGSQDGGTPAREYLGLSAGDRLALEAMALDLFGEAVL